MIEPQYLTRGRPTTPETKRLDDGFKALAELIAELTSGPGRTHALCVLLNARDAALDAALEG